MRSPFLSTMFLLSAALLVLETHEGGPGFIFLSCAFVIFGAALSLLLASQLYAYSSMFLGFHVAMAAFSAWVYVYQNSVVPEKAFSFSTFTDQNLKWSVIVLVCVCATSFVTMRCIHGRARSGSMPPRQNFVALVFGQIARLPNASMQAALVASIALGLFLFITNPSVLDLPYPFNEGKQWAPSGLIKVPTVLAAAVLLHGHAQILMGQTRNKAWLNISRVSFIFISLLMLVLSGGRGIFTFFWIGFACLELYSSKKSHGSVIWSAPFLTLAWLGYSVWPFMRLRLVEHSLGSLFSEALSLGLGSIELGGGSWFEVRLTEIPMIGQSLFHLLYVIQLESDGISLSGLTFTNLLPQALPSFLDGVLWTRPENDNWLLMKYYVSGGGFLVTANTYWNGGLWVSLLAMNVIAAIAAGLDRHHRRSTVGNVFRFAYWLSCPVFFVQLAYGLQGLVRVVEFLLLIILIDSLVRGSRERWATRDIRRRSARG